MSANPFILADQDRVEQFAVAVRSRGLFRQFEQWTDSRGVVWAGKRAEGHCFAVSLLGPGWVFDPYAAERRAEDLAERRQSMESADPDLRLQELQRIVDGLRLGPIAERMFWVIHRRVMQAKRSVVRIPDRLAGPVGVGSRRLHVGHATGEDRYARPSEASPGCTSRRGRRTGHRARPAVRRF